MLRVMCRNAQLPIVLATMARRRDLSDFEQRGRGEVKGSNPMWEYYILFIKQTSCLLTFGTSTPIVRAETRTSLHYIHIYSALKERSRRIIVGLKGICVGLSHQAQPNWTLMGDSGVALEQCSINKTPNHGIAPQRMVSHSSERVPDICTIYAKAQ